VFAVTMLGYSVARQLLRRALPQPIEDVRPSSLARTVRLNELYLVLAERHRLARAPFVWIAANATELPWQKLNDRRAASRSAALRPTRPWSLPAERIRVFLEDEMASGPSKARRRRARLGAVEAEPVCFVHRGGVTPDVLRAEVP